MVRPRFGEDVYQILLNLNSWNRLPKDLQDLLTNTAIEMEEEGSCCHGGFPRKRRKGTPEAGDGTAGSPPPEAQKFLNTSL